MKVKTSEYLRKFGIITSSNILIQAVSTLGFVFIANVYNEEHVGEYVTFLAYVGIITILSTGYFDQALYVEKRAEYLKLLKLIPVGFAVIGSIPMAFGLYLAEVPYVPYIIISVIAGGLSITATNICITQNRMVFSSIYKLITAPLIPGATIVLGILAGANSNGMIAVYSIISIVLALHFYFLVNPYKGIQFNSSVKRQLIISLALIKRYRKFFFYGMFGELIGTSSFRVPVIQINSYFGVAYAGYFGIAIRILITPISVLTGTVSQMFLHKVSMNKKMGIPSLKVSLKLLALLSILGAVLCLLCVLLAETIIIMLIGDNYVMVAETVFWLSPFLFVLIAISPLTQVLTVYEKQEYAFYNKITQLILSVGSFYVGFIFSSYILGVQLFSLSMTIVYIVILGQIFNVLLRYDKAYKRLMKT